MCAYIVNNYFLNFRRDRQLQWSDGRDVPLLTGADTEVNARTHRAPAIVLSSVFIQPFSLFIVPF